MKKFLGTPDAFIFPKKAMKAEVIGVPMKHRKSNKAGFQKIRITGVF